MKDHIYAFLLGLLGTLVVLFLQKNVYAHSYPLTSGLGSPSNKTDLFDAHTYQPFIELSATGYLGPPTRALLSATSTAP
jgi:hypothetical protein